MGSALDNQKDQSLYHLVYSLGISAVFGAVDVLFLWPQTDLAHALETTGECDAVGVVFVRYRERAAIDSSVVTSMYSRKHMPVSGAVAHEIEASSASITLRSRRNWPVQRAFRTVREYEQRFGVRAERLLGRHIETGAEQRAGLTHGYRYRSIDRDVAASKILLNFSNLSVVFAKVVAGACFEATKTDVVCFSRKRVLEPMAIPRTCSNGHSLTPDNLKVDHEKRRWRCRRCGRTRAADFRARHRQVA